MLGSVLAWSAGVAGGVGSTFIAPQSAWRYASPLGVWLTGLWLNNTWYGVTRRFGEGAAVGGAGAAAGLFAYDVYQQYLVWFGPPKPAPVPPKLESESHAPEQPSDTKPDTPELPPTKKPDKPEEQEEPQKPKIEAPRPRRSGFERRVPNVGVTFMTPPRVSQGHYTTRGTWWEKSSG